MSRRCTLLRRRCGGLWLHTSLGMGHNVLRWQRLESSHPKDLLQAGPLVRTNMQALTSGPAWPYGLTSASQLVRLTHPHTQRFPHRLHLLSSLAILSGHIACLILLRILWLAGAMVMGLCCLTSLCGCVAGVAGWGTSHVFSTHRTTHRSVGARCCIVLAAAAVLVPLLVFGCATQQQGRVVRFSTFDCLGAAHCRWGALPRYIASSSHKYPQCCLMGAPATFRGPFGAPGGPMASPCSPSGPQLLCASYPLCLTRPVPPHLRPLSAGAMRTSMAASNVRRMR